MRAVRDLRDNHIKDGSLVIFFYSGHADGGLHVLGSDAPADDDVPELAPPSPFTPTTTAWAKVADTGVAPAAAGMAPQVSSQVAQGPKPFKPFNEWSANEVFDWLRSVGEKYTDAADAMRGYGIDGNVLLEMLANDAEELTLGIEEGGLGLQKIQVRTLKFKVEAWK